jgi:hypothetical protein
MSDTNTAARARNTDPQTSHDAAEQVTPKRQSDLTLLIWRLVSQYPDHNMRWYVNKSIEENGMDAGWYGTLGTNFSKAVAAGYIEVSGTQISEYTKREVQTYRAVGADRMEAFAKKKRLDAHIKRENRRAIRREEKRLKKLTEEEEFRPLDVP